LNVVTSVQAHVENASTISSMAFVSRSVKDHSSVVIYAKKAVLASALHATKSAQPSVSIQNAKGAAKTFVINAKKSVITGASIVPARGYVSSRVIENHALNLVTLNLSVVIPALVSVVTNAFRFAESANLTTRPSTFYLEKKRKKIPDS